VSGPELARRGAQERLAPILTTNTALALIALPFVVLGSRPGLEVVHPMAVVLLGGLVTATFLTLFVLPALYARFAAGQAAELPPDEDLLYRWADVEPGAAPAAAGAGVGTVPVDHHDGRSAAEPITTDGPASRAGTAERGE
jgi:hypothetical protein